jgi:hypothetical protein
MVCFGVVRRAEPCLPGNRVSAAEGLSYPGAYTYEGPTEPATLLGEGHAGELLLEGLAFGGIGGFSELTGELEESSALGLFGFETGFDQIHENVTGARLVGLG